jgi:histidinol phosphatase-like PHP family hydrolase
MPYPDEFILKYLAEKNANVMLNSDCHSKDSILCCFDEATEYAKACGIKELCVYENKKIKKIKI